jgi:hypothetical protein
MTQQTGLLSALKKRPTLRHPTWWLTGIGLVLVVVVLGVLVHKTMRSVRPQPLQVAGGCVPQPKQGQGRPGAEAGPGKVTAKLREGQVTQVDFGRSNSVKRLTINLDLSGDLPNGSALHVTADTFRRDDDGRLSTERVVPNATVFGRTVQLVLCLGRADARLGDPGLYRGSVTLDDSRLANSVTVPIAVTMQFVHGAVLWWLFLPIIVPGTWVLWVLRTQRGSEDPALAFREIWRWIRQVGGVGSVVSGTVAAVGVYIGTYVRDQTWGSSALQPVTLFGAMFSAFITTAGLTQLTHGKVTSQVVQAALVAGGPVGPPGAAGPSN